MEKLLKILTDPASNYILQKIRIHKQMTISEILAECTHIPRATLYRKIERMREAGAIYVTDTNKVRGQTENIYAIKTMYIADETNSDETIKTVTFSMMRILTLYEKYFKSGNADVNRDKLFMLNYAIALSDSDFSDMMNEIFQIVDKYQNKSSDISKIRNLYLLSAPGDDINE